MSRSFFLIVFFVLLNMIMAVIMGSYDEVRREFTGQIIQKIIEHWERSASFNLYRNMVEEYGLAQVLERRFLTNMIKSRDSIQIFRGKFFPFSSKRRF